MKVRAIDSELEGRLNHLSEIVCKGCNVDQSEMRGSSRKGELAIARHCFAALAVDYIRVRGIDNRYKPNGRAIFKRPNLASIGHYLNGRDHSTISSSIEVARNLIETDRFFRVTYEKCKSILLHS